MYQYDQYSYPPGTLCPHTAGAPAGTPLMEQRRPALL